MITWRLSPRSHRVARGYSAWLLRTHDVGAVSRTPEFLVARPTRLFEVVSIPINSPHIDVALRCRRTAILDQFHPYF